MNMIKNSYITYVSQLSTTCTCVRFFSGKKKKTTIFYDNFE